MNNLDPKSNKKIKLSSAQISVLEDIAKEHNRYVRKTTYGFEIRDASFNLCRFIRTRTFDFLQKHGILIQSKRYNEYVLNPEIKGWEHFRKHLRPELNPKVNWYNNG